MLCFVNCRILQFLFAFFYFKASPFLNCHWSTKWLFVQPACFKNRFFIRRHWTNGLDAAILTTNHCFQIVKCSIISTSNVSLTMMFHVSNKLPRDQSGKSISYQSWVFQVVHQTFVWLVWCVMCRIRLSIKMSWLIWSRPDSIFSLYNLVQR